MKEKKFFTSPELHTRTQKRSNKRRRRRRRRRRLFRMFRFGGGGGGNRSSLFEAQYRAYPVSFIDRSELDKGDKIILPPSALDRLSQLGDLDFPMLFNIENVKEKTKTHCGVLEFIADEGVCYLPYWMMQNLRLVEGDVLRVKNARLPKGTFVKLQPQTSDFLNISNPKAVLETCLRNYTCLTVNDTFMIEYNNKRYFIDVIEAKPADGVCVVETDCEVDFAAPLDYVEPDYNSKGGLGEGGGGGATTTTTTTKKRGDGEEESFMDVDENGVVDLTGGSTSTRAKDEKKEKKDEKEEENNKNTFLAFAGSGNRLDGKAPKVGESQPVKVELPTTSLRVTKEWQKLREGGVLGDAEGANDEKKKSLSEAERAERKAAGKVMFGGGARVAAMARKKQKESEKKSADAADDKNGTTEKKDGFSAFKGGGNKLR
jgi:ubiquitin fusion degradation protein 1